MVLDDQISEMLKKIWKTITIGFGPRTGQNFCQLLDDNGFKISRRARSMLERHKFIIAGEKTEINLVKFVMGDITSGEDTPRDEIRAIVREYGLIPLSASLLEVAPHLRLQYLDQPENEQLLIDMESICDSDGFLNMFGVKRTNSEQWLYADYGNPEIIYSSSTELIFVRPRE